MSIVTRHGDGGETGLLYGGRVPKDDLRCEAYGLVDEAVSALGLARALAGETWAGEMEEVQRELFTVGAELATDKGSRDQFLRHFSPVTAEMVEAMDVRVTRLEKDVPLPKGFVLPGGTPQGAAADMARSTLRTAERRVVSLVRAGEVPNSEVLRYLNRTADYLFMLARALDGDDLTAK